MSYLNKKNYIYILLTIFISFFTLYVIFKITNENSLVYLKRLDAKYISIIMAVIFSSLFIDTIRISELLNAMGEDLPFWYLIKFNLSMFFITAVTPFGSGSLPLAIYLFNKKKIAPNKGLMIFTSKLLFSGIFFGTIPPVLLIFFRKQIQMSGYILYFGLLASCISTFLLIVMIYIILKPEMVIAVIRWFNGLNLSKKYNLDRYCQIAINETIEYNKRFKELFSVGNNFRLLSGQLVYSVVYWILFYSIAPIILIALKIHFNWFAVVARQFIFYDVLSYNFIPSGAGIMEVGFTAIFSHEVPKAMLGIFIGIWRFFTYHVYLLISSIGFSLTLREYSSQKV